jgi:hypothetical protein
VVHGVRFRWLISRLMLDALSFPRVPPFNVRISVARDAAEASERTQADNDVYNEAGAVGVGSHLLSAIAESDRGMRMWVGLG